MAVGARQRHILWQFLLEAVDLVGGVTDVVVGFVSSLVISLLAELVIDH